MIDGHATQNGQWVRHSCVGAVDFLSVGDCFDSFVGRGGGSGRAGKGGGVLLHCCSFRRRDKPSCFPLPALSLNTPLTDCLRVE